MSTHDVSQTTDRLNMDYINSLPQPFLARLVGDQITWPVYDIEVGTGLVRIDVCGKLQITSIGEVGDFIDANGVKHDPETFYSDHEPEPET